MRERAGDSGGQLEVRSTRGEGTQLTAEWRFEADKVVAHTGFEPVLPP